MAEPQPPWPGAVLGAGLAVSRRGVEAERPRPAGAALAAAAVVLCARVKALAAAPRPRDGRRRLGTQRQEEGGAAGRAPARQWRRQAGVGGQRPQPRGPVTTERHHRDAVAPNRRARQDSGARPDQGWVGEISAGGTAEGWWSVSTRLDWDARQVGGGGRGVPGAIPLGCRTRGGWRGDVVSPQQGCGIMRIAAVTRPATRIKTGWPPLESSGR
jgi:hypothetical protein